MFTFIDLFSGIGGFHQAMNSIGGKCLFASEIDKCCINVYKQNYKIDCECNIKNVSMDTIPEFDMLCAGFPCQPFSKAGKQEGFRDSVKGTLFFQITRILESKHPKYIMLENVRNIISHDKGNTWMTIQNALKELGYITTKEPLILSPHQFGIPQLRERVIIPAIHKNYYKGEFLEIQFENLMEKQDNSIYTVLDLSVSDDYNISQEEESILSIWDEFIHGIKETTIGFPIWADYFRHSGNINDLPKWKQKIIKNNIELYKNNQLFLDIWIQKYNNLSSFKPTYRKFEWQCGNSMKSVWDGVIQFRPSGIRVKKTDCFPALVAMVQTPIIGKYKRRITEREAARLQSFPEDFKIDNNKKQAYKQFGNSVNVKVIAKVAQKLIDTST